MWKKKKVFWSNIHSTVFTDSLEQGKRVIDFFSLQVFTILDCYKKTIITEEWEYLPHQIIAVGTHWNKHTARLIKEFMNDPYVVITAMEEASIYGNVHQVKIWG